jgi:hypothetical protein
VGLDLELGRLYLEAERLPDARRLLLPIASDPHGGSSADQAREMLLQAGLL